MQPSTPPPLATSATSNRAAVGSGIGAVRRPRPAWAVCGGCRLKAAFPDRVRRPRPAWLSAHGRQVADRAGLASAGRSADAPACGQAVGANLARTNLDLGRAGWMRGNAERMNGKAKCLRACLETTRGAVFVEKAGWRDEGGAARSHHRATPKAFASRAKAGGLFPENPPGGGSFVRGRRWLVPYSPLRGCAELAALATAKIPRRSAPRSFQTGSKRAGTVLRRWPVSQAADIDRLRARRDGRLLPPGFPLGKFFAEVYLQIQISWYHSL